MGSDSFEWSTDVDSATRRRKTLLTMQDNRRIPRVGSTSAPMTVSIGRQRPPATSRGLLCRNPLHEDIVQAAVGLHPATAGPIVLPGASICGRSPIDQGAPLILERTR